MAHGARARLPPTDARAHAPRAQLLAEYDNDGDGFINLKEFVSAVEVSGNALRGDEMEFLFMFWDTMAGAREPTGQVEVAVAAADLFSTLPAYVTGFTSGYEPEVKKGGNSNRPSQEGGIFAGGSYEADAAGTAFRQPPPAMNVQPRDDPASAPRKPKGNESSVPGGIFSAAEPKAPSGQDSSRCNRSNRSSVPGGIFADQGPVEPLPSKRCNSNASSIPGGIFG